VAEPVALSGVTDPYQPVERRLGVTRGCLEVLARRRNPVIVITKSDLVVRDIDILVEMAGWNGVLVQVSVTTLDADLARRMEPRAAPPQRRLDAIERLAAAGIPVGVLASPIVPGLTDWEIPRILAGAAKRGARFAGYTPLRLPFGVAGLFEEWLGEHAGSSRAKVLNRIQSIREGRLNDPRFRTRMRGQGPYADQMSQLFRIAKRRGAFEKSPPRLNVSEFRSAAPRQRDLFD
jgi:DNA repair photolyase